MRRLPTTDVARSAADAATSGRKIMSNSLGRGGGSGNGAAGATAACDGQFPYRGALPPRPGATSTFSTGNFPCRFRNGLLLAEKPTHIPPMATPPANQKTEDPEIQGTPARRAADRACARRIAESRDQSRRKRCRLTAPDCNRRRKTRGNVAPAAKPPRIAPVLRPRPPRGCRRIRCPTVT